MHLIDNRTYVGRPGEEVTVTTSVNDGGQACVIVDGVNMGPQAKFKLPAEPGDLIRWQIALSGPRGATCVVVTTIVDDGSDTDFLMCQDHTPAPVHFYTASAAGAPATRDLQRARTTGLVQVPRRKARRMAGAKKKGAKKTGTKGGRS
jgi:hypothetical protein